MHVHVVILYHAHRPWGMEARDPHFHERGAWLLVGKRRWHMEGMPALLFFILGMMSIFYAKHPILHNNNTVVIRIITGTAHFFSHCCFY